VPLIPIDDAGFPAFPNVSIGSNFYFAAWQPSGGVLLYRSNGTSAGTVPLSAPGGAFEDIFGMISTPSGFIVAARQAHKTTPSLFANDGVSAACPRLKISVPPIKNFYATLIPGENSFCMIEQDWPASPLWLLYPKQTHRSTTL
jgi:hypothetical protein